MVQIVFSNSQLQDDMKHLTSILHGVSHGIEFDVDMVEPVVKRFGNEFYKELENELKVGMKVLKGFRDTIIKPNFDYCTEDLQISRKSLFALEDKMLLSMLKGNIIFDINRGRSIIRNSRISDANYRGLEEILKPFPELRENLSNIDFVEIKNQISSRRFRRFEEEYKKSIEPYHINEIYNILPEFERIVEQQGGEIINISAMPFKYGEYTLTSMVQNFDKMLGHERHLKAIISKFDDKGGVLELTKDIFRGAASVEGKSIPGYDVSLTFMDETGTLWLIANKDDLMITIHGDNPSYFKKDSVEIAKAYLRRNRSLKIRQDERRRKALNHGLTLEYLPPLWYIERSMDREGDISYLQKFFSMGGNGNGDRRQLLVYDIGASQKRYDDRIEDPKPNKYQTILYRLKIWETTLEWQFRTKLMHYVAEETGAEHSSYKRERYEDARKKYILPVRGILSRDERRKTFFDGLESILNDTIQKKTSKSIGDKRSRLQEDDTMLTGLSDIQDVKNHLDTVINDYINSVNTKPGDWSPVRKVIEKLPIAYYENAGLNVIRRYEEAKELYPILAKANNELESENRFDMIMEQPEDIQMRHYEALVELAVNPRGKKRALFSYGFLKLAKEYEERIAELPHNERFGEIRNRLETAKKEKFVTDKGGYHHKLVDYSYIKKNAYNLQLFESIEPEVLETRISSRKYMNMSNLASLGYDNLRFVVETACAMVPEAIGRGKQK